MTERRTKYGIRGFAKDCEKYNTATSMGWQVFRVTADMLREDPQHFISMVAQSVKARH